MSVFYPVMRLRAREGRRVLAGAPWAFSNEIQMDGDAKKREPGTLVRLADSGGAVIGTGYFNPRSLIAVRLLSRKEEAIDAAFLKSRLNAALRLRERFYSEPFYRLVHAEGDDLAGLVVDRFDDALTLQVNTAGMEALTPMVLDALDDLLKPRTVILRNDAPSRGLEGLESYVRAVKGKSGKRELSENGVRYLADLSEGQKSGWYYDQRDNRALMASLAKGKTVLDLYCSSGGFALACAAGGGRVKGIDSSEPALGLAREAAMLNGVSDRTEFLKEDVFEALSRLQGKPERFDLVIADPPPFVKSRKDLEAGARAYRKLAREAAQFVARGGFLFLASCSHNIARDRFAAECAAGIARAGRRASLIKEMGAGADHPAHLFLPETAYLKAQLYALD